jgi:hypothetical protein
MTNTIHFDPRATRPVAGGVVVSFDDAAVPGRVEIIETAAVVTIMLFDDWPVGRARRQRSDRRGAERGVDPGSRRHGKFARHEVFVPLYGPLGARHVIDGHEARDAWLAAAS